MILTTFFLLGVYVLKKAYSMVLISICSFAACKPASFNSNVSKQSPAPQGSSAAAPAAAQKTAVVVDKNLSQPSDHQIVFGQYSIFHLGDGEFDPRSKCASTIEKTDLSGLVFKFSFELLGADSLDIKINTICGIDNGSGSPDLLKLINTNSNSVISEIKLTRAMTSFQFHSPPLTAGSYVVEVDSIYNEGDSFVGKGYDDFIVGGVNITSNTAKIVIKEIKAE